MRIVRYQCHECGHQPEREECTICDDPQAPFGPELLCPKCEGLVFVENPTWLLVIAGLITVGLSIWLASLVS